MCVYIALLFSTNTPRQDLAHDHGVVAAHRADDRLDRVEVHVVHDAAMARQAVSTPHPLVPRPLDRQRGGVIHVHEPVATPAARHRQVGAPRAPQQVPAGSLLRLTRPRHAHRVSAHQLHAAALALEERVDVPHAQPRVQRVAQSTSHLTHRRVQVAAVGSEADPRD